MHITIKAHQTSLNQKQTLQMERRIHFALGRFVSGIDRVRIRLTDSNGPKGGQDKQCLIIVKLRKGGEIVVQGKGVNNSSVLNHCANRISRAVDRELSRRWKTPIRKMRKGQASGMIQTIESEEKLDNTIEKTSMVKKLPATVLLTSNRTEQKMIALCE